jgi:hypothetical protein
MGRDSAGVGQHCAQKGQLLAPPVAHLNEILRASQRRAKHQKHDLRKRIDRIAGLAGIAKS